VITGLYGGTDWGITDNWLTTETPTVLIATVEKAEALMRYVGRLLIHRLALLIIDEAHQVVVAEHPRQCAIWRRMVIGQCVLRAWCHAFLCSSQA
jgi:hypothetical protein